MFKLNQHEEVMLLAKLSERIKLLRTNAGLTQEDFGKIFGIVKSTVSLYESGKSCPNDQIKIRICEYFKVPMDFLIGISSNATIATSEFSKTMISDGTCHSRFVDLCTIRKKRIDDISTITGIENEILRNWFITEIPSLDQLIQVADCLCTSVDYLLCRTDIANEISQECYEFISYYNCLTKLDQRWIVGQMTDMIKKNEPKSLSVAADKKNVVGK